MLQDIAKITQWRKKIRTTERESKKWRDRLWQERENLSRDLRKLKETMAKVIRCQCSLGLPYLDQHNAKIPVKRDQADLQQIHRNDCVEQ
jgi:hypothetical protein